MDEERMFQMGDDAVHLCEMLQSATEVKTIDLLVQLVDLIICYQMYMEAYTLCERAIMIAKDLYIMDSNVQFAFLGIAKLLKMTNICSESDRHVADNIFQWA